MQFSGRIDKSVKADAYDIDAFETSAPLVAKLHDLGRHLVCYIDAGSWEKGRPDADRYPASVKGKAMAGWPGERWLDIRQVDVLAPILEDRIAMCAAKCFDGVEFDNVDGYSNKTGFPLTAQDQLAFDRWLADTAHADGLAVGLKNTPSLAKQLEPSFDFSIVEQCVQYRECGSFTPFLDAGEPVLDIEYSVRPSAFCPKGARVCTRFSQHRGSPGRPWRCAGGHEQPGPSPPVPRPPGPAGDLAPLASTSSGRAERRQWLRGSVTSGMVRAMRWHLFSSEAKKKLLRPCREARALGL